MTTKMKETVTGRKKAKHEMKLLNLAQKSDIRSVVPLPCP